MEFLEIADDQGRRRHVRLNRPRMLVGREPTCEVCLPHPSVSRRHAQLQREDDGRWLLQDLNSLNHVYVGDQQVQQIILEPGKPVVRIADFHLTLQQAPTPAPTPEGSATTVDKNTPSWPGLEPGWLEQLQGFQRTLLRLDEPRQVLERLAQEFQRVARPEVVAVGLATAERYAWEVVLGDAGKGDPAARLDEAGKRVGPDDSEVLSWTDDEGGPRVSAPLSMLFPMKGRSGVIGHVYVQRPRVVPLPPSVQRYLGLFATHAGLIWDNLQVATLRQSQKVIEQELRQARQIQIELFPATFNVDPRLDAFAINLPSVRVSGDYYDLVRTGPDTVAFVIADAMGHGMPAALLMASVRSALRMGLSLCLPWPSMFKGLDDVIAQAKDQAFVTGLVGQIDLAKRELRFVSAGHCSPSVLVGGAPVGLPPRCQTRPWGLDFESNWELGVMSLGDGDWSILCYTDGISEAAVRPQNVFGADRVAEYHRKNHRLDAEDLCEGLISEVAAQQRTTTLGDDQTVLVLRNRRPAVA